MNMKMESKMDFEIGDRVTVHDEGLEMLASVGRKYGFAPETPNNVGVIDDIRDDTAYIIFDDCGQCAPYPLEDCFKIGKNDG